MITFEKIEMLFPQVSSGKERLSNLAVIYIETEYIRDLSQNPRFYEDVIDKFANLNFHYLQKIVA